MYSKKGSPIVAASVVFNYETHVSVTDSAGNTVDCPTVSWQVWEVWRNGVPSGDALIINVTGP